MKNKNVLILTYWSYHDALIQTYTLPYVRIIKKYLPAKSKIFLVTLEQKKLVDVKSEYMKPQNTLPLSTSVERGPGGEVKKSKSH